MSSYSYTSSIKYKAPTRTPITGTMKQVDFDRDNYVKNLVDKGTALADSNKASSTGAAQNTLTQTQNDLLKSYGSSRNTYNDNLSTTKQNLDAGVADARQTGFQDLQQMRETSASRGLGNSGLGMALQQGVTNNTATNINDLNVAYSQEVSAIKQDVANLVNNYGMDRDTANNIYNTKLETINEQYNQSIKEATADAESRADEHQLSTDTFNVGQENDWTKMKAQLDADWDKMNAELEASWRELQSKNEADWKQAKLAADAQKAAASISAGGAVQAARIAGASAKEASMLSAQYVGASKAIENAGRKGGLSAQQITRLEQTLANAYTTENWDSVYNSIMKSYGK